MNKEDNNRLRILLVEDSKADQLYYRSAINATGIAADLHIAETTEEARGHLFSESKLLPHLILLDLYLHPESGKEWLEKIKKDEEFGHIPVVILTTSNGESDIHDSYLAGAHMYVVKDFQLVKNLKLMKQLFAINWKEQHERPARDNFVMKIEHE